MYEDMRHFVVFRLPQDKWENGPLNSATLDEWIHEHTLEGRPCVCIGETDFRHHYLIAGFSTPADADALRTHVRSFPFVEIGFDLD
jgi:hypothetical protein